MSIYSQDGPLAGQSVPHVYGKILISILTQWTYEFQSLYLSHADMFMCMFFLLNCYPYRHVFDYLLVYSHSLPRVKDDFEPLDKMYEALEATDVGRDQHNSEIGLGRRTGSMLPVDADSDRKPRSMEEMITEARTLAGHFPSENRPRYNENSSSESKPESS